MGEQNKIKVEADSEKRGKKRKKSMGRKWKN